MISRWYLPLSLALALPCLRAANDSGNDAQNDSTDAPHGKPALKWTFDDPVVGTWQGKPKIEAQGPQAPMFPDFPKGNKAASFPMKNGALVVKESDVPNSSLRFAQGDAITIEAWVNLDSIKNNENCYIIGKGRNKNKEFQPENQNYALRLRGVGSEARMSFLFRTESEKFDEKKDYHRWTAEEGFTASTGWHHVAVSYTFGKPASIQGFMDGKRVKGVWDMGGKTEKPPVTDADDLMIGAGNGNSSSNALHGWLDDVAIYHEAVADATLIRRFKFVPPPPVLDEKKLVKGKVLVQICEEGVPEKNAWPALPPTVTESYEEDVFGIFEVPQKYVDTGVRGDRSNPYILRAAAKVSLPAGKHRLLMRGRNMSRLYVDGKQVLTFGLANPDSGGHGHVTEQDKFLDLGPDFRFAPPGTQETWAELPCKAGEHVVILEQLVGGVLGRSHRRPEPGEMVVAVSLEGKESWELVSPGARKVTYTDAGWAAYESERRERLEAMNAKRRVEVRTQAAPYWETRRKAAAEWLASTPEVKVPEMPTGLASASPIDHFITAKIASITAQNASLAKGGIDFFNQIQPIFDTKCLDCHRGAKPKGGLKLDTLANAQKGGKSDGAAVMPGKPEESAILKRVTSKDDDEVMPPKGEHLTAHEVELVTQWIKEGARWPEMKADHVAMTPMSDDLTFLRRVTLDIVGVAPSLAEIETFTKDTSPDKRAKVIDRLLKDPRWADNWMGYWEDVLAENPNILNPTLNNTGPFRWWIYESLLDDKPMDLFVTELLRMKGSERFGGPAGFGVASQNDVPMAAKGTIISNAFLGVDLKCARCHDSPTHKSLQRDLFELAAMLKKEPVEVPKTSSVPMDKLHAGGRKPMIQVTLQPGTKVAPKWPFDEFCAAEAAEKLAQDPKDPRDCLAALITAPQNERFAQVMVNRIWARLMGRGIMEPVWDWEKGRISHPELLRWLGREFIRSGYSMKEITRLIVNSQAYQRATDPTLREASPLFASPAPRRLGAEQIVDSLFAATGKPFNVEEVSLDIDGRRDQNSSITLGKPRRCWMLTSTSNERDRPSLALPRNQAVCDVLAAFGWHGSRQEPVSKRDTDPNALQPAILSNGTMGIWLTRLSDDHGITKLAMENQGVDQFIDRLFLQLLTRKPTGEEKARYTQYLAPGFENRIVSAAQSEIHNPKSEIPTSAERRPAKYVSWSNHLDPEATIVRQEQELAARRGDPPTEHLNAAWRQRLEDVLWALLNAPEWVFAP